MNKERRLYDNLMKERPCGYLRNPKVKDTIIGTKELKGLCSLVEEPCFYNGRDMMRKCTELPVYCPVYKVYFNLKTKGLNT
jgi:hypothetical protein